MTDEIKRTVEELNEEADIAADFIEGFLDPLGLDGDLEMVTRDDRAVVEVVTEDEATISKLVGKDQKSLAALQTLTRAAVRRKTKMPTKLIVDVAGTRRSSDEKTIEDAKEALQKALEKNEKVQMRAMNSYKRRLVHDFVKKEGYLTKSQGAEPYRKIVIYPEKLEAKKEDK
jgi:spoIIIJ-associated protein